MAPRALLPWLARLPQGKGGFLFFCFVFLSPGGVQVLFFRGLPADVRDFEVTPLLSGFCDPSSLKTLVLYGKGQALVEVPSVAVAGVCVGG